MIQRYKTERVKRCAEGPNIAKFSFVMEGGYNNCSLLLLLLILLILILGFLKKKVGKYTRATVVSRIILYN